MSIIEFKMTIKECIVILLSKEMIDKEVYETSINIFTQCMNMIKGYTGLTRCTLLTGLLLSLNRTGPVFARLLNS